MKWGKNVSNLSKYNSFLLSCMQIRALSANLPSLRLDEGRLPESVLEDPEIELPEEVTSAVSSEPAPPGPWLELLEPWQDADESVEAEFALHLHKRLLISLRQATDPTIWRYATAGHFEGGLVVSFSLPLSQ